MSLVVNCPLCGAAVPETQVLEHAHVFGGDGTTPETLEQQRQRLASLSWDDWLQETAPP